MKLLKLGNYIVNPSLMMFLEINGNELRLVYDNLEELSITGSSAEIEHYIDLLTSLEF